MNLIKEIHESELFGIIIETGCSTALSSKLMDVEGASKTIFKCEQPYSKEQQKSLYGDISKSVSKEFVDRVLDIEKEKITDNRINFIIASSWQLNKENPNGYMAIELLKTGDRHVFHFSFEPITENNEYEYTNTFRHDNTKVRNGLIDEIGEIGLDILHSCINGIDKIELSRNSILDIAYKNNLIDYELLFNTLNNENKDYFLTFINGVPIRFIDLMRKSDTFVVNKGSFDPIHIGHQTMMEMVLKHCKDAKGIFTISINRYDKPKIETNDLINRIKEINSKGYPVIINKNIYFYDAFDLLKIWATEKCFRFCIGTDTLLRILETDAKKSFITNFKHADIDCNTTIAELKKYIRSMIDKYKNNFKFLLFPRLGYDRTEQTHLYDDIIEVIEDYHDTGVSSTKIRNSQIKK